MMRVLFCLTCRRAYQVIGDLEEVKQLLDKPEWERGFPCTTPLCRGTLLRMHKEHRDGILGLHELIDVPVKQFYRAIHGFGLGDGEPASVQQLRELLTKERVIDIVASSTGSNERVIVSELVMSNGTRIHLGASHLGACVYYIEGPQTCLETFENEIRIEEVARGSNKNRKEAGRDSEAESTDTIQAGGPTPTDQSIEQSNPGGVSSVPAASNVPGGTTTRTDEHNGDDSDLRV